MMKLSGKNLLLVGLTLFSMFFGAGNLIFPPFLGAQAGTNTWIAMTGFAMSAIGFPILGVIAVARSGGLDKLAGRVHSWFAFGFTLLIYLSIGPCLAIPRTASTSFEMAVVPFLPKGVPVGGAQLLYSVFFFAAAYLLALRPDKLTDRLGKILTPCLLTLIAVIFAGCILKPAGHYGIPQEVYRSGALVKGFLDGYLTMDTIAALNFGIIISLNIQAMGIVKESSVVRETVKAGLVAGCILLLVYCSLAHIGAVTGGAYGVSENGARTLSQMVHFLYGDAGMVMLGLVFLIACLNTCIGLISCCSKYFCSILPVPGYRAWALVFAVASLLISNVGLSRILELSLPVLNAIYPAAIVLIILSFLHPLIIKAKAPRIYPCSIACTGLVSILMSLEQAGIPIAVLSPLVSRLPLYGVGLAWTAPAVVGAAGGLFLSLFDRKSNLNLK